MEIMENKNTTSREKFKELLQQAQALLNMPSQKFEDKYSELTRQTDKETPEKTIEIRLHEEGMTINCLINKQKQCTDVYFFFDKTEDEDAFIDHLVDYVDYSFRKRAWLFVDCLIKTREIKDILAFYFCKQL